MNKKKEYDVTIDVDSFSVVVEADSVEEAGEKALAKVRNDPNYFWEMSFFVIDDYTEEVGEW